MYPMSSHRHFRHLQPVFFSGLFDDPVLCVHVRPTGRSMLFDCGQIHHLAKRILKSVDAVFISHAHMDHFMGIDTLIRNVHVSPQTVTIVGPPGIAAKTCHKFAAYDWNLTEMCWASFRVQELHPERVVSHVLPGPEGFPCRYEGEKVHSETGIFQNEYLTVQAGQCDHKIPSLIFRIDERPAFGIDETKLERNGLVKGEWLRVLKRKLLREDDGQPLPVLRRTGDGVREERVADYRALYAAIRRDFTCASIGYMTDIGFSEENVERVVALLKGVTLLVCECAFLADHRDKARLSHHLCTSDLNRLVDIVRPHFVLPMHLSKTHAGHSNRLYDELEFPPEIELLRLPDRVTPRPLLLHEGVELLRPGT